METMALERPSIQSVIRWARTGFRERRVSSRRPVSGLWCDKGQVLDLSAHGVRLQSPRRWQEGRTCTLTVGDGDASVTLEARCVWCRQDGLFSHQVGVMFENTEPDAVEQLARLVAAHAVEAPANTAVPPQPNNAPEAGSVDPGDTE